MTISINPNTLRATPPNAPALPRRTDTVTAVWSRPPQAVVPTPHMPVQIVVAHYQEDLGWLRGQAERAVVYNKGGPTTEPPTETFPHQVRLPNIGRESHSYLRHIVDNYDNLEAVTLFVQGAIDDHMHRRADIEGMVQQAAQLEHDVLVFRTPASFRSWRGIAHTGKFRQDLKAGRMQKAVQTPAEFYEDVLQTPAPRRVNLVWGAIFAVRRDAIMRRPKAFYEDLLSRFETLNHSNPEEGHFMERFWLDIFSPQHDIARAKKLTRSHGAPLERLHSLGKPPDTTRSATPDA